MGRLVLLRLWASNVHVDGSAVNFRSVHRVDGSLRLRIGRVLNEPETAALTRELVCDNTRGGHFTVWGKELLELCVINSPWKAADK